ncbi:hypothetical protein [Granulicella arctica]|uniref:hypothetical protein n=1 Tax=Granulicella arctica TaxID=940613 RepID=UPI0021E003C8|nr:hypothetical protein [Granulicella arctica]
MAAFLRSVVAATLLLSCLAFGQTPTPQLSPQAAYDEVTKPLEITRRSIGNWSDAETGALGIAVKQASEQCSTRSPDHFAGDDLIAFARLCALGQQWPIVSSAAGRYITNTDPTKPQLAQAYAYQIDANLHANDPKAALASSQAMLKAVPYEALADEATDEALHYLQLAFTPDALTLYADREPLILALLAERKASPNAVPIHKLYTNGLAFAALQQLAGSAVDAAVTVKDVDTALATVTPLPNDESILIADARRQYALLGKPLPRIRLSVSLYSPTETPRINRDYGASTVLFLFPDWCAQCIRMGQAFLPALFRISEKDVHLYGLLAQPTPPVAAPPKTTPKLALEPTAPIAPKTPAEILRGTPTLIVPPETLAEFAATDFPLLIATDPKGIIRFIQPASENALNPGDFLDQVIDHIALKWPREPSAKAAIKATSTQP